MLFHIYVSLRNEQYPETVHVYGVCVTMSCCLCPVQCIVSRDGGFSGSPGLLWILTHRHGTEILTALLSFAPWNCSGHPHFIMSLYHCVSYPRRNCIR